MNTKPSKPFYEIELDVPGLSEDKRDLYRTLYAALSIQPILFMFIAIGFGLIYLLGLTGLLDANEPRLLIVSTISIVATVLHFPVYRLMRLRKIDDAAIILLLITSVASSFPVFIWQGIVYIPFCLALIPLLVFATQRGIQNSYKITGMLFVIALALGTLFVDGAFRFDRMIVAESLTQMAALSIFIMVMIAMAVLIVLNTRINFRTISGRLVAIFTFVAFISALTTLIISALANLYNDRQRIFQELNAVSLVRSQDIEVALNSLQLDSNRVLTDPLMDERIMYLLQNKPGSQNYQADFYLVRAFMAKQLSQNSKFQEILLVGGDGRVISSTQGKNTGQNFSASTFFQNVLLGINYAVEYNFPASLQQSSILLARPYITNGAFTGAIVARSSFDNIKQILASQTGIGVTVETYMVGLINGEMIPLTNIRQNIYSLNTHPAEQALMFQINQGSGIWNNYAGKTVMGSFFRIPAMKTVLIAEIEQQEVTQKTINISLTNSIIGLFTLLLAFVIVFITSRSISLPIVDLADNAADFANGKLETRITVNRKDEIGTLATSFNGMADELQTLIQTLEKKVKDRTQDLEKQANYLRVAAEIARDATTARNLDDLLNNAALLILNRFGFYHTGIFLLDEHKEYAVLRASPTEAGQEMLARHHRLKIGEVGIVGNVAASGVSRVALDTGIDPAYFNNPLLPDTHSEIALPLKVNNNLIGVLDVQSQEPNAFTQDDISILQIMADQLALAIQRVILSTEQEDYLREIENAYQSFTLSSWKSFSRGVEFKKGYSFDGLNISPIENLPLEYQESLLNGRSVVSNNLDKLNVSEATLAVPLKLRDRVIGALTIGFNSNSIPRETISLAEEIAGRLAIALENARLYSETQMAAERERAISQASANIGRAVDIDSILRYMAEELGGKLKDVEVAVQIGRNDEYSDD